jgi:hypothetical protein
VRIRGDLESMGEDEHGDEQERVPCLDGNCVGSMGEDGRCRLCGKAGPSAAARTQGEPQAVEEPLEEEGEDLLSPEEDEDEEGFHDDEPDRVLCADDSCVGSVGEDGYCRVCGLLWKEEGYPEEAARVYREEPEG